jgi:phosphoserine phosphatase
VVKATQSSHQDATIRHCDVVPLHLDANFVRHDARLSWLKRLWDHCRMSAQAINDLTQHFPSDVAARLFEVLAGPSALWVTDADGTLWRDDIGEAFLRQLVADAALVSPEAQGVDVWESYEHRVAQDKAKGYAWAVQIMAGMPEAEVVARARTFAETFVPAHVLPEMQALLRAARNLGCDPWIVSASSQWIVAAAAPLLQIRPDRVLGVRLAVQDGLLTSTLVPPVTFRGGKVEAIQKHIGQAPTLVTGDSSGDVEMMQFSTGAALLIVHPWKTDPSLRELAQRSGWLSHEASRSPEA